MNRLFRVLIFILFLFTGCKKEKKNDQQSNCPGSHTFTKNISAAMGSAALLNIYEDNAGGIHVAANDNGSLKIFQFDNDGNFIRNVSLGTYNVHNALTVADAYYTSSYTEQDQPGTGHPGLYQGFKQLTQFGGTSTGYYVYDTIQMPRLIHSATTRVTKVDFTGNNVWTQNYNGYLPNSCAPVIFSSTGTMYLFTIDYKGEQRQLLINDTVYNYSDPNRPNFYLTDTMLLNDTIHSFIVSGLDPATGNVLWQKTHLFNLYEEGSSQSFYPVILSSGIVVSCGNVFYSLDLQGNYLRDIHPIYNDCPGSFGFSFIKKAFNSDNIYTVADSVSNPSFLAMIDAAGNELWNFNYNYHTPNSLIPVSTGFIVTLNGVYVDLYPQTGTSHHAFQLCNYVNDCSAINYSSYTCASCSGDILHIFSYNHGATLTYQLVRTNGNGNL